MGNHICPWWLAYTFDNPLRTIFHKPDRIFSPYVKPGMTVADIGCGMGYFSIGLAKIVTDSGKVIAVDLQPKMLEKLEKRAEKAGVLHRIRTHLCEETDIGITEPIDFALAFWMVHETPDVEIFYKQVFSILTNSGMLLVAEPKMHVSRNDFDKSVAMARKIGFQHVASPHISFSHTVVLARDSGS